MPYNINSFLLFLIFVAILTNCKNRETKFEAQSSVPESFWPFYEKFHNDSIFQIEHIVFPLQGLPAQLDSTIDIDNYKWSKSQWQIHRSYDDMEGTFHREFVSFSNIVMEVIHDSSRTFQMTRRFSMLQDEWHLIYYEAMRKIK